MLIYLLFCNSFSLGKEIRLLCFAFLPKNHLPVLCGEAAEGLRPIFKVTDACRYRNLKGFQKFSACPPRNDQTQSKVGVIYLVHAQGCMSGSSGKLHHDGAFLAYIQEKKMKKEAEIKNALGTIFCRKESTNKSTDKCTNPLLIVLFHTSNCPEDSVLQPVEEEMGWETVLLIKCSTEPAVSASVSGYALILLSEIKRKCLTSRATIILVKLVLLKHRLQGLLLSLDCLFLPFFNFTPVLKNAITCCD